jgi:ABC-type transport system involved in cytochrome c biogenesis permease subunit
MGKVPIQRGGRVKPLYVHARDVMKHLGGETSYEGYGPVVSYCLLSVESLGLQNPIKLSAPVEHVELKTFLGLSPDKNSMTYAQVKSQAQMIQAELRLQGQEQTSYQKSLSTLLSRLNLYMEIQAGQNWVIPAMNAKEVSWPFLTDFLQESRVRSAVEEYPKNPMFGSMMMETQRYLEVFGPKVKVEYYFAKARLPVIAMLVCFMALAALTLFKHFKIAMGLTLATVLIQTVYIVLRIYISGRAPITNMYETVLFSGYGALLLSMVIGHFKKEKTFLYMGLGYNVLTLLMINFAHGMLNPTISPLVPVLRDNFWLSTHVTMVIMSYGAYALSWILANTLLIKKKFSTVSKKDETYYCDLMYTCLKVGSVLLAGGVLLGGVWADYSWGRFWGWDPKETWSLIALCLYVAIQHGRYTSWIPNRIFVPFTAAAFMSIMMAWFGVNYILASGLHSYGFSQGGAVFLGSFFLIQTGLIAFTMTSFKRPSQSNP